MAVDPQVRATEGLTREVAKMTRLLEAINTNIVAVANALNGKNVETVVTKPTPQPYVTPQTEAPKPHPYFDRTPTHITPPGADPYGTQR